MKIKSTKKFGVEKAHHIPATDKIN